MHGPIVEQLLASPEPAIRWKVRAHVLGESGLDELRAEVRESALVRRLLDPAVRTINVYAKWQGAHWVLGALADLGYPPGDAALVPLRDRVLDHWLDAAYFHDFEAKTKAAAYGRAGVPVQRGRHRAHASQQGYALWFVHTLGLADERCERLADLLRTWRWPDGGWNCDRDPAADTSSFMETLLPMRGLARHGDMAGARAAAEVFLTRRLLYRAGDGSLIRGEFVKLHYPLYWHYDLLAGLKGLMEVGLLGDPRCRDALDVLESLRLPDGWPATARYYRASPEVAMHNDWADWGGTSTRRANPWVTADALAVLRAAGRLSL